MKWQTFVRQTWCSVIRGHSRLGGISIAAAPALTRLVTPQFRVLATHVCLDCGALVYEFERA